MMSKLDITYIERVIIKASKMHGIISSKQLGYNLKKLQNTRDLSYMINVSWNE